MGVVVSSLRERHKARTSAAIAAAALQLFAERGFDAVTVAEVAAAAGVGERTLYRYAADKEELLFTGDAQWRAEVAAALAARPAEEPPFAALRAVSLAVPGELEGRRAEVRRRAAVIAAAPALAARERAKQAAWEALLAEGLAARGVPAAHARLLGRTTVACFEEALTRWATPKRPHRPLTEELAATFAELADAIAAELPAGLPPHGQRS